ncbi:uncharacterized protein LACBIDRAFT_329298 [Laccaria bicolor S238N-H82]|uniref:Predicted protein n=1 Tax=Laccaria bicolor (strain S238N-H82 / ATCC MYA-4686) TaxID=486041 RepID=B0DHL0_LACBS|nr:uncharacterized protein LACBIDRAFT_329298 [Laccaria bicolor S238N-H82]EDR05746.1 predicted protein [Laccaria bicolor S238N-H82]|eukprot:XP_001883422.1 predicted protein [Laccaria bicolor S238N-H82]
MDLGDDDLLLQCVIEGESEAFLVNVKDSLWHQATFLVADLKEKIHERQHMGSFADALVLWKPKEGNSINTKPKQTLPQRVASARNSGEELDPTDSVLTVFPDQPSLHHIHIIVRKPDAESDRQKRKAGAVLELDVFEQAKKAKLITMAPSDASKTIFYENLQRNASERILDDRPSADSNVPPAPLLYSGFGHFLDIYNGLEDVPSLSKIDFPALEAAVDDFADKMAEFFVSEDVRRDEGLPLLNAIFSCRKEDAPVFMPLHAESFRSFRTDEHNIAAHRSAGTITEFKNKITEITSIPHIEATAYFAQLNIASAHGPQFIGRWRVPCLGITVIGDQVTFYAIILLGHQYRLISLTPTLSCLRSASDLTDRTSLYRAFAAASVLDMRIFEDVRLTLANLPPLIPSMNWRLPAVSSLRKYSDTDDPEHGYLDFQIHDDDIYADPSRLLFLASTSTATLVVIKFTRRYCAELHALCAKLGRAPQLLAFERLPGGWFGVAMNYISTAKPLRIIPKDHVERPRWYKELKEVLNKFHGEDLVHGDLRDTNIIVEDGERVLLVDFDWGGRDGETAYPKWNLHPELKDGRTYNDLKIRKEDDERILAYAFSNL